MNTDIFERKNADKEYKFLLWNRHFTVWDENELALIFETLSWNEEISWILHWNVIMELDDDLWEIITSYKWLISCLKFLNEKNYFLLLIKIWDYLSNIVQTSSQLWEILARISEEQNKLRLIKQMRNRWLSALISNYQDLLNIIEWVFDTTERQILELLWIDIIKNLFVYPEDIYNILHYLDEENKDYLIDMIWLNEIAKKIKTSDDFLYIIKWLSTKKAAQFMWLYSKNTIKELFKNDEDLKKFIFKLSDRKEKIFLDYMKK